MLRYLSPIGLGDEDDSLSVIFVEFIDSLLKKTLSHFALFKKGFLFQHVFYTQLLICSRYYQEIFRRTQADVEIYFACYGGLALTRGTVLIPADTSSKMPRGLQLLLLLLAVPLQYLICQWTSPSASERVQLIKQ